MSETSHENELAEVYEKRSDSIQQIVDECAKLTDLDEFGIKTEIAEEVGVGDSQVHYVINEWSDLIEWRRESMGNGEMANGEEGDSGTNDAVKFVCPDCEKPFEREPELHGHLTGSNCERPDDWKIEDSRMASVDQSKVDEIPDGIGELPESNIEVEFTPVEAFRAIRFLPSDLGIKIFSEAFDLTEDEKTGLDELFDQ